MVPLVAILRIDMRELLNTEDTGYKPEKQCQPQGAITGGEEMGSVKANRISEWAEPGM